MRTATPASSRQRDEAGESSSTVVLAGVANFGIAIAKLVGGLVSGSTAMLAEAAHSFADTVNQVFLLTGLKRSERPADSSHPFGYAQERYFWALLAAVGIFVLGAGYSIYEGIHALLKPEEQGSLTIAYVVLGIAFVLEGASWAKAVHQVRGEAADADRTFTEHLRTTPDPTVKTVAFEDSAALVGIVLAAAGITLHHVTGAGYWDGVASISIGVLLIGVAYALGRQNMALLIGQSVPAPLREGIRGDPRRPRRGEPGGAVDPAVRTRGGAGGRPRGHRRLGVRGAHRAGLRRDRPPAAGEVPRDPARLPRPHRRPAPHRWAPPGRTSAGLSHCRPPTQVRVVSARTAVSASASTYSFGCSVLTVIPASSASSGSNVSSCERSNEAGM